MIAKRLGNKHAHPVAATIAISSGQPCRLASGYLTTVLTAGACVGLATLGVDNSTGASGALQAEVEVGEFKFTNAGDVVLASVGSTADFSDANTVSLDSATKTRTTAGTITQVDDDGVWVRVGL